MTSMFPSQQLRNMPVQRAKKASRSNTIRYEQEEKDNESADGGIQFAMSDFFSRQIEETVSHVSKAINESIETSTKKLNEAIRVDEEELIPTIREAKSERDETFVKADNILNKCKNSIGKHEKSLADLHKKLEKNTIALSQVRLDLEKELKENVLNHKRDKIRVLTAMKKKLEEFKKDVTELSNNKQEQQYKKAIRSMLSI